MQYLLGTPIAKTIKSKLKLRATQHITPEQYIVILRYGDNLSSAKYVHMKQKFWLSVGIATRLIGQGGTPEIEEVISTIQHYNQDPHCIGIMCQLPLPESLHIHKVQILESIDPSKDIDWLTGSANGRTIWWASDLYPATVASILGILDHYGYGSMYGKTVTIINRSNLIGKPLAMALVWRNAQVIIIGRWAHPTRVQQQCQMSDILITATGKWHLIGPHHIHPDQVIIDAGADWIDGKLVGDVHRDAIDGKVKACTPAIGWVWPMTVACLFDNVRILYDSTHNL